MENQTFVKDFLLLGFSNLPEMQLALFCMFLVLYISTLTGNVLIITLTRVDSQLDMPMYFFLSCLSFLEICYTSVTVPKMLINFLAKTNAISFPACATQLYFFISLGSIECTLLAVMAYDRYVAVCNPLCYPIVMNKAVCLRLVAGSWLSGFLNSAVHTSMTFHLPFCSSNQIQQFFCDIPPLLKLACTDTRTNNVVLFIVGGAYGLGSFLLTLISYIKIILTVLKIHTSASRRKTFSTCTSHLIVVSLFFGTSFFMYLQSTSKHSLAWESLVPVFYAIVTPILNPIIYSLRNKEVKAALQKLIHRKMTFYKIIQFHNARFG
ncbi:olfactory receptor 1020-like [Rhinatrema bivittatum]|uniref:olfactory receptor 1020-like n=1 Tax=Rhinatrema bivittatum TaxID=194408 RepID=UPI0011278393|nr:olfactory receptor 1020-like [Rhinatrema bivittatum]